MTERDTGWPADKLAGKTLDEAARNDDGTYNGIAAMRWMVEAVTRKPMTDDEARALVKEAIERRDAMLAARKEQP